jgi:hypothetical protein
MDFKLKIETDFQVKSEPNDDIQWSMKIIDNIKIPTQVEIKNENIAVPCKRLKVEIDVKPKIVTEFNIKSELSKTWQDLPDELILKILSYSEAKDLISCGHISKRTRNISRDSSLWVTANLEKKIVKTELLEMIKIRKGMQDPKHLPFCHSW